MAPPSRSGSRPVRTLAGLAVLIVIMLISILGSQTFSPGNWHNQFKVGLGLDLSNGTEVVLKAATSKGAPDPGAMQQAVSVLLSRVNGTGNSGAQVQQVGSDLINITVPGKAAQDVINLVSSTAKLSFRPVLLEEPYTGPAAAGTASPSPSPAGSGTASPSPSATGSSSGAPKVSASPTATGAAAATASASAKASTAAYAARLAGTASPSATASTAATTSASAAATTSASPGATASGTPTPATSSSAPATLSYGDSSQVSADNLALFNKMTCTPGPNPTTVDDNWKATVGYTPAKAQWDDLKSQIVSCDATGTKYVLGPAVFDGASITSVQTGIAQNTTQWVVNLTLNNAATKAFGTLTTNQYNNYFADATTNADHAALDATAIVLDGSVQSAPQTQGPITAGQVQITGPQPNGFSQADATDLANVLKYGSLPLTFTKQTVQSVSAQVGRASLDAGLFAGILGLLLVVIYMFYYYRGLGIVSVTSLLMASLLSYLSVVILSRYQNFTMSLSAIAGLVVAIGITADSFIVYFERLRDEVRDGKTLRPAVESGWKRARRTILVSDTVQFLAAILLYHFAVSDVQGFAFTLGLTTLVDVLVVFMFTKPFVTLLAGTEFFGGGHRWSGLDPIRLGAKTPWRSGLRRTVRTQRTTGGRTTSGRTTSGRTAGGRVTGGPPGPSSTADSPASPSKEA